MEENNIQSQRRNPIHYLLLKNYRKMSFIQKRAVEKFLSEIEKPNLVSNYCRVSL